MTRFLLRWIALVVSLVLAAVLTGLVLPGQFVVEVGSVGGFLQLAVGVVVLALVNATLGNLIKLLTLPLNCLTLGLVSLLVNALMFQLVGTLGFGFRVTTFWAALVGSLLYSAVNAVLGAFLPDKKKDDKA